MYEEVNEGVTDMMVFVCVDCNGQCFIVTRESIEKGLSFLRQRWRQVDADMIVEAHILDLEITQPIEVDI